ncbi:HTH domain-containing protein [Ohtaekwangia sp.]|uniref:HTH domain-containing protein n=1 Tax=Ohtaekwangia sp. TaxID=2066019 RepID=UPI0039C9174D
MFYIYYIYRNDKVYMDFFTYSQRLDYLLEIIQKGQLSSPNDLVSKFECTERTIRKMIGDLRRKGYLIKYSRKELRYTLINI